MFHIIEIFFNSKAMKIWIALLLIHVNYFTLLQDDQILVEVHKELIEIARRRNASVLSNETLMVCQTKIG